MSSTQSQIKSIQEKFSQARKLQSEGKVSEAIAEYRAVLELDKKYLAAWHQLAQLLEAQEKWDEAAEALLKLQKWEEAAEAFKRAIALKPNFHWLHYCLGEALLNQHHWVAAEEAFRQSIKLKDNFFWSHYKLGEVLVGQGLFAEAVNSYQRSVLLDPTRLCSHQKLGEALLKLGQWSQAESSFRQAIEIQPDVAFAYYCLGEAVLNQGRKDEAMKSYSHALELNADLKIAQQALDFLLGQSDSLTILKEVDNSEISRVVNAKALLDFHLNDAVLSSREVPVEIESRVDLDISKLRRKLIDTAILEQFNLLLNQELAHVNGVGETTLNIDSLIQVLAEIKTDVYYLKTKLSNQSVEDVDPQAKNIDLTNQIIKPAKPRIAKCDLSQRIVGTGWYSPEVNANGRWTGPGTVSSLVLPYPIPGKYKFEAAARAEAIPGLLKSLKVHINSMEISIFLSQQQCPAAISGEVEVFSDQNQPFLTVDFLIEKTVCPQEWGETDSRSIGLFIEYVRLIPV